MIGAVIIDDEAKSRDILKTMLTQFCPEIKLLGESGNLKQAIQLITRVKPQMAFLDINMPNGTGFDILNAFPEANFQIVFVTAHNEYAIKAIRASALDFLMKPINFKELQQCVQRAKVKLFREDEHNNLKVLIENLHLNQSAQSKIAIPDSRGLQFIMLKDIVRLEADGNYTLLWLQNGEKILSTRHLKEYEDLLPSVSFFRSHHSHIINLQHIVKYNRGEGGSLSMDNRSEVPVAKRRKKLFLKIFKA